VQGLHIKVYGYVFRDVSAALSPSRKITLGGGAHRAHQRRLRLNRRKSPCHARFREMISDNVWFPKCSAWAPARAAAAAKWQIMSAS